MCQKKKKKMIDRTFRIDISPDKFMHTIAQQKRTDDNDKNGQIVQEDDC